MKNFILLPTARENAIIGSIFKYIYLSDLHDDNIDKKLGQLTLNQNPNVYKTNKNWEYNHLYKVSDEKIQEGDWVIAKCNDIEMLSNQVYNVAYVFYNGDLTDGCTHFSNITAKKIVKTTDKTLKLPLFTVEEIEIFIEDYNLKIK